MDIDYESGPLGLHVLAQTLRDDGLEASYDPPIEERGTGDVAIQAVIHVAEVSRDAAIGATALAIVKPAIAKLRERFPGIRVEIRDED